MNSKNISLRPVLIPFVIFFWQSNLHAKKLRESSFEDILRRYTIVADFAQKPTQRPISDEIFWHYKYTIPVPDFELVPYIRDFDTEFPATVGEGRAISHMNRARLLYMQKSYEEAKTTLLSARARYGKDNKMHRRNDYYTGYAFLALAEEKRKKNKVSWRSGSLNVQMDNASTFLSWAFVVKKNVPDPLVDQVMPKGLFNLAAIYFLKGRYAGSYATAREALDLLRRQGLTEFRPQFRRLIAESHIRNRSYLAAVQFLDTAIRQDPDAIMAAKIFARIGDIFFDLNNYELAEDMYALTNRLNQLNGKVSPMRLILQGESLFWMGKFEQAIVSLHDGLLAAKSRPPDDSLPIHFIVNAQLRLGDAYLAHGNIDQAKLTYFRLENEFPNIGSTHIARIRRACFELPFYRGQNIRHARELLTNLKKSTVQELTHEAKELAWACEVSSYTDREVTQSMVERVEKFFLRFPNSRFLKNYLQPVTKVQSQRLDQLLEQGEIYAATDFYLKNKSRFFKTPPRHLRLKLFRAFADTTQPDQAALLLPISSSSTLDLLRKVAVTLEINHKKKNFKDFPEDWSHLTWDHSMRGLALVYLRRIISQDLHNNFTERILSLLNKLTHAENKTDETLDLICSYEFPLLSKSYKANGVLSRRYRSHISQVITKFYKTLVKQQPLCARALVDFENAIHQANPLRLKTIYSSRKDWPHKGDLLALRWTLAETLHEKGLTADAEDLWRQIVSHAPKQSLERKYSLARLDKTKTVIESLWD